MCPKTATVNNSSLLYDSYSEYDESTTDAGATLSTVADPSESLPLPPSPQQNTRSEFEKIMKDTKNARVSRYQNTYFMDGGNRFISVRIVKKEEKKKFFFLCLPIGKNNKSPFSYQHWVTPVQKQLLTSLECLKTGFKTNYITKAAIVLNDCQFWKIPSSY